MHKANNIYFLLIKKKKRYGPSQGVAQGTFPYLKEIEVQYV